MSKSVADLTERELIARIQQHLPPAPDWVLVGIGDDAAVVQPERNRLAVLSVDALVEGIHFDRAFTPPDAIGHRALAANLSDLAAMGATPRIALLSLALPPRFLLDDFDTMVSAIAKLAARHRLHVAGGNLTRSPAPLVLDITVVGSVKPRRPLTRSGARPGDELYVTGSIGSAAAGLQMLRAGVKSTEGLKAPAGLNAPAGLKANASPEDFSTSSATSASSTTSASSAISASSASSAVQDCILRYLYPEPRVRVGSLLATNRAATACIDLSDGLGDGVHQIARASGVGAVVDAAVLPIAPCAREWFAKQGGDLVLQAAAGGDDYELLFAVRPRTRSRLRAAMQHGQVSLTRIGICTADPAVVFRDGAGEHPLPEGYTHFR